VRRRDANGLHEIESDKETGTCEGTAIIWKASERVMCVGAI
jgi:hypothetical protein